MGAVLTRFRADAVIPCDEAVSVFRPGVVDVEDGRITWVGPADEAHPGEPEQQLRGLLMPGLVNVHCHSAMTLFRGSAEDMPLERFLHDVLWPRESRLTQEDVFWGMTLGCAELLRNGVTTSCEMYFFDEALLDAVVSAGTRCVLTPGLLDVPGLMGWERRLEEVIAFHDRYAGSHETVEIGFAPHSAYALPFEALSAIVTAARERNALLHIHVAETAEEGRQLEHRHGKTVPTLLADAGALDGRIIAAHSVWLTDDDLRLFSEHDVAVAHCPTSNAKLAAGIARLREMLDAGLRVGLGTDGPASNNDLDLWEELRLAALLARLTTRDAAAISAPEALTLATRGGAEALGRDDIGSLEAGRWADMALLRLDDPAFAPLVEERDLVSHLVWAAGSRHVRDVWVAGRQVVANGECVSVDEVRALREVQERAVDLARR